MLDGIKMCLESVFSDVTQDFISNPYPALNKKITIKLRMLSNSHVEKVLLRVIEGGKRVLYECTKPLIDKGFSYYSFQLRVSKSRINYHFILITASEIYFYNQKEISTIPPIEDYDFLIISDLTVPKWVQSSVFYQIFPDRFFRSEKYTAPKFQHRILRKWNQPPLSYAEAGCRDFFGGNLAGIEEKIEYFKEIGVNALYLTPVFKSDTNHRYDITDYSKVDPLLGSNKDLISLIRKLHANKIRIILDITINHTGKNHFWHRSENHKVKDRYLKSGDEYVYWDSEAELPVLDWSKESLKNYFIKKENSILKRYCAQPFCCDGWRFDVGNQVGNNAEHLLGHSVFREIRKTLKTLNEDCYLLGEHTHDAAAYLDGYQWDGAMNFFAASRPLRWFYGEVDFYQRFFLDQPENLRRRTGIELGHQIKQHYERLPAQIRNFQYNLIDCHDAPRFHTTPFFSVQNLKGMLIALYLLPGSPGIYYGSEVGLQGGLNYPEEYRYPMDWCRENWNLEILALYVELNRLKKSEKVLQSGSHCVLYTDEDTYVQTRFDYQKVVVGITAKTQKETLVQIPILKTGMISGLFRDIFNHQRYSANDGILSVKLSKNDSLLLVSKS